MHRNN